MKVIVLGADGYLGWPTVMKFADKGHIVYAVDNELKRKASRYVGPSLLVVRNIFRRSQLFFKKRGIRIVPIYGDVDDFSFTRKLIRWVKPDVVIHYAEIPSAPFSMSNPKNALLTVRNNLTTTLSLIYAVMEESPDTHIIKLGTLGEYGTPHTEIPEGWIYINKEKFLWPMRPGSLYHVTKVQDTHMLWFYTKTQGLRVTDIMQGPVYGLTTREIKLNDLNTSFHYDAVYGTVFNRFVTQVLAKHPLTVYGLGNQTRGYLHLEDVVQCVELIANNPPEKGDMRIVNQFVRCYTINQLAEIIQRAGIEFGFSPTIEHIENPRIEEEDHPYEVKCDLLKKMGLKSRGLSENDVIKMFEELVPYAVNIKTDLIMPEVSWRIT